MQQLPDALAPLAAYRQFIVCQFVPDPAHPGKTFKYPIDYRTGYRPPKDDGGGAHDPRIWTDAATACSVATSWGAGYGVGFVFTEQDPFFFFDLDNCLVTPADGSAPHWSPIVHELCGLLPGAATEISQSGHGLHIIGTGFAPADRRKKDYTNKLFDLYTEKRFVALTGTGATGSAATQHTAALHEITEKWLKRVTTAGGQDVDWTEAPAPGWNGPADDEELLRRAMQSHSARAAFGPAASFADLWTCDVDALTQAYPPDGNGALPYDASRADRALAQHLAFWTGNDCARIRRLMERSELRRDKWERESYMAATILGAVAVQGDVLADKPVEPVAVMQATTTAPIPTATSGSPFVDVATQIERFKGITYLIDQNKALMPGGETIGREAFKVIFGGFQFVGGDDGKTTKDAWEAFTLSQSYRCPRANTTCFRPDLEPGALVDYDGQIKANTWWPVQTRRVQGDPRPFLLHLAALLPDERDRAILLAYMAAVVQHKGVKFQWAPLIQGVEGNGKTLLTRCVAFAVGRRYSYFPKASDIADKFNDWMYGSVFIGVEDIYIPNGRDEVTEELKTIITGDEQQIQGKGEKKATREVCCNIIMNSNHQAGARKRRGDRRIAPFFTAQQTPEDLAEWGMDGDYFPRLYAWLRADGYAIVNEYLQTYAIPDELNPARGLQRAPVTSSTEAAIQAGMGGIEQQIIEATEQGIPGFAGGWISSLALDALLTRLHKGDKVPLNERRSLLNSLGYDRHPGLAGQAGRVNNAIAPDGGRPVLYLKIGHPAGLIVGQTAIAAAYTAAQMPHFAPAVP